jgi:hypothetical protein
MTLSIGDLLDQNEFWIFLFLIGTALLNWPILSLASGKAGIFGFPLVLIYIVVVWLLIIFFAFLFDRRRSH